MRGWALLGALLGGCAAVEPGAPENSATLTTLLRSDDPLRREEAAHRLSLRGTTVHEAVADHPDRTTILERADRDTASMRDGVDRACREFFPGGIVRSAYHVLRGGCVGRDWRRVREAIRLQRFQLIEIYEPHDRVKYVRFLARASAYVNAGGNRHDLIFWVKTVRAGDAVPARWIVGEVYVGLHVSFEEDFKLLAARGGYPPGSVLAEFFGLPEIGRLAVVLPVLEEVEFSYGRIHDKEAETVPAGFQVNASFVGRGNSSGIGRGVLYTAACGLDPPSTRSGRLLWDGFTPEPTVGPLTFRGNSFWGAGGFRPSDD